MSGDLDGATLMTMSKEELLELVDELRGWIEADDSMEGWLTYAWGPRPGTYEVGGALRFGNRDGQGFTRLLWAR